MPTGTAYPTQSYLTPASMDALAGEPVSVIGVGNNWQVYDDSQLGIHIQYPPDWTVAQLVNPLGVGFYPQGSQPDLPTPAITFRFLNQSYTNGSPLYNTGSTVSPINIAGIEGQQYQDTKFSVPTQSFYIELPYRDGTFLIDATHGPVVDLTPQLFEILKTLNLSPEGNSSSIIPTAIASSTMVFPTTTPFPVIINPTQSLGQVIIEANPVSGKSPLTVSFYAGFLLPDGDDACAQGGSCRYYWDVNGKSSRTMSYTFRKPGSYFVTVSVCYAGTCSVATQGIQVSR